MGELFATFGIDWKLLVVQVVNFLLLLAVLWYFLYRPVIAMMEKRRSVIAGGVAKAAEADTRLKTVREEEREIIGKASQEAEQIIASARVRADEKGNELLQTAHTRAEGILEDAAAQAEEAHRRILKESEREVARTAVLAAEKILRERSGEKQ